MPALHCADRLAASGDLEQSSGPHATTDAHRHHDVPRTASLALDQRVSGHPSTRHTVGMADRDGSAIHIDRFRVDAQPIAAMNHLAGERLIQLPQSDVIHLQPMFRQQLRHGEYRPYAHLVWRASGHGDPAIYT